MTLIGLMDTDFFKNICENLCCFRAISVLFALPHTYLHMLILSINYFVSMSFFVSTKSSAFNRYRYTPLASPSASNITVK
jgi:hypothetical protein